MDRIVSLRREPAERGPAELTFVLASRRHAGTLRSLLVALIGVFGVMAAPAGALPLVLVLLTATVALAAFEIMRRSPRTSSLLAVLLAAAICLAQPWTAPIGYDASEWAFNVVAVTAITLQWQWPVRVATPLAALLIAVQWTLGGGQTFLAIRVLVECAVARVGYECLLLLSRRLDRLRLEHDALQRSVALADAQRRQLREQLALLHDTVASTLLMVASSHPQAERADVAQQVRRDLALLTAAERGHPAGADLVAVSTLIGSVAEQSTITVTRTTQGQPRMPARPALAMLRALREALTNIERHAGVTRAELAARSHGERVIVELSDQGTGFEPNSVSPHRRGISASIVERLQAVGGQASITTTPGSGTTVRLEWPAT
ncbi:sensor histidine kinase [Kineosporia babensis]|uniref:Histidine kinase/HSP90-like ATPase domain-containing protein n=1 Tax=Kineosporia babensis TaxID=499548 RepID=A0A9X1NC70_9ACTN|nr:ATP-binding protein [Kineosporia babensis]MCD5311159.1 hypothetical protein [Kineosporia babensis]